MAKMSIRRSIDTKIWGDVWFETLNPKQKLIWIYLLINSKTNMLGIYEISINRISYETGLSIKEIETILKAFEGLGKAFYWFGRVFLPNWIRNQAMNTNMMTSAKKEFELLPNYLKDKLKENGFESFESLRNRAIPNFEIEIEIEKEIESGKNKFKEPLLEEVKKYCQERDNNVDAIKWFNFYESKGWMIGKNKMKNWKAAVITWEKNKENKIKTININPIPPDAR